MTFAIVASVGIGIIGINAGSKAAKGATALDAAALAFSKQQYEDWKAIYGPLESNLAEFYNNLTPDYIEAQGLQAQQLAYQATQEKLTEFFAVNEIDSGVSADLFTKTALQNERDKAVIRADAPFKTAQLKQGFLALGLASKGGVQTGVTNALNTSANRFASDAQAGFAAAGTSFGAAIDIFENRKLRKLDDDPILTANQGSPGLSGNLPN